MEKGTIRKMVETFGPVAVKVYVLLCQRKTIEEIMVHTKLGEAAIARIMDYIGEKDLPTFVRELDQDERLLNKFKNAYEFRQIQFVKKGERLKLVADGGTLYEDDVEKFEIELVVFDQLGDKGLRTLLDIRAGTLQEREYEDAAEVIEFILAYKEGKQVVRAPVQTVGGAKDGVVLTSTVTAREARKRTLPGTEAIVFQSGLLLFGILVALGVIFMVGSEHAESDEFVTRILRFTTDKDVYIRGEPILVRGESINCGAPLRLYVDTLPYRELPGNSSFTTQLSLSTGTHEIEIKGEKCEAKKTIVVENPECREGDVKECFQGTCRGESHCEGGRWGECIVKRECYPGQTISCTFGDGCTSGTSTCDECGRWGPCK